MAVTMPVFDVVFRQLAGSLVERSARGVAVLIVRDGTGGADAGVTAYADLAAAQRDKAKYTADNYAAISDVLTFAPHRFYVVRIGKDTAIADAFGLIERNIKTGWVTIADATDEDAAALVSWIKAGETKRRSYKAVVYNATTAPDSMRVVNFVNPTVTFADSRGKAEGGKYLPSLVGIAAVCNIARGMTNYLCANLSAVEEVADNDAAVGAGKFVLVGDEDGDVRVGVGVNSLTTINGETLTEDMKYIEIVEAMDMMRDDIRATFRRDYLGNYRNTQDNQMLFVASVNGYYRQLAAEGVLNPDYDNAAYLDAAAQRDAWVAAGKAEAAEWDDATVLATPYKRQMFLAARNQILFSMTDMTLVAQLM